MFTGLIEEVGTVKGIRSQSGGMRLSIAGKTVLDGMKAGDSIAVNGACLTVVEMRHALFGADVSKETLTKTTLGRFRVGDRVNLERAMRPADRLGGHLVAGHVDAVGVIRTIKRTGEAFLFTFEAPPEVSRYLIYKGSIAIRWDQPHSQRCPGGEVHRDHHPAHSPSDHPRPQKVRKPRKP